MSIEIKAYKCEKCGKLHQEKGEADRCCKCTLCKHYIGRFNGIGSYVHCRCGYSCDSYFDRGFYGTYSRFEMKED